MSAASIYCGTCGAANPPDAPTCFACGNPPSSAPSSAATSAGSGAPVPTGVLATHSLVRQRYRLLSQIGTGGFGAVYQAEDTELGNRKVAVKEMSQRGLTPEELQEGTQAFRNEVLLLASLTHPNLPRIYEQFSEGGRWYLVMDFIEGETLEERLSHIPGGRLPVVDVLKIGLQLCTVLDYLHMRQPPIIFRDLKPANIMVTPAGGIFLIDFGIARHFKPGQTKDTVAFGSAGYAAPEQYGKAQTTTQSDIYSLGATLHHLLSGSDPANSPFIFAPLHLADPDELGNLIMQMLDTHSSKRPASVAVIQHDLQRMADDLATGQKQPRQPAKVARPSAKNTRQSLLVYQGHTRRVRTIAWSPDGTAIASGGDDRTIQMWDSASGRELQVFTKAGKVSSLAWSPDGRCLAWVSGGLEVRLWSADTDDFSEMFLPHKRSFFQGFLALAWSPDGSSLAAGGMRKTIEIWKTKTRQHLLTFKGHRRYFAESSVYALAWSPDGAWMASASTDGTFRVWKTTTLDLRWSHREEMFGNVGDVAWSPDGHYLASAMEQATVSIWDAATGEKSLILGGHTWTVRAVAWSPDGKYLASGRNDRTVRIWDVAAGKEELVYSGHEGEVNAVAWSPDSTRVASASDDAMVHIWQVR